MRQIDLYNATLETDIGEIYTDLTIDKKVLEEGKSAITFKDSSKIRNHKFLRDMLPLEFTYGYAITAHKSQRK